MATKEPTSLDSKQMVRQLVDLIRSEGLTVGDRMPSIRTLSEQLNVSTSLVRDAMVQAQAMGLIKMHPRSGAFVQSLNFATIVDSLSDTLPTTLMKQDHNLIYVLDARRIVEMETVAQAAQRRRLEDLLPIRRALETMSQNPQTEQRSEYVSADIEFHLGIAQAAGNPVMTILLQSLLNCLRPYLLSLHWTPEHRLHTEKSHSSLYEAILKGNVEAAIASMQGHLGLARDNLLLEVQAPFKTG
jgi:GntR family transcriptional regulator, transcriptional repressor for pyruvate dehydrogenase complex